MSLRTFLLVWLLLSLFSDGPVVHADDWPQWNGPTRDGKFPVDVEISLPQDADPLWKMDIGLGYSGPVVVGDRVLLTDYLRRSGSITNNAGKRDALEGEERITCFDRTTGKQVWQHTYDRSYEISYPAGPRATPVVNDGMVYALGSEGNLVCLDLTSGSVVWQSSFNDEFNASTPLWGHAASPLVYGSDLICMVGGPGSLVVAFDLKTGNVKWQALTSEKNETGYCPPTIVDAGGTSQLMIWSPTTLYSLNPDNGSVHWEKPMKPDYGMSILPPVTDGKLLFVSGEGSKSAMFRLAKEKPTVTELWRGKTKQSVYLATSNAVFSDKYIYGADIRSGALMCFEAESGNRLWQSAIPTTGSTRGRGGAHASAFLIELADSFLILSETGDLIHANLTPNGYEEIARVHILEPTTRTMGRDVLWTYPAFDGECIYARNDKHLVCYRISSK